MSANLVRYYHTGGFDDGGNHFQSSSPYPVAWWGIVNEPDINGLSAQQYTALYNTVVPQMRQADPSIKFVAAELSGSPLSYSLQYSSAASRPLSMLSPNISIPLVSNATSTSPCSPPSRGLPPTCGPCTPTWPSTPRSPACRSGSRRTTSTRTMTKATESVPATRRTPSCSTIAAAAPSLPPGGR